MERRTAPIALISFGIVMLAACSIAAFFMTRLAIRTAEAQGPVSYQWLHEQLGLAPAEQRALEAIEQDYQQRRAVLQADFEQTKQSLTQILASTNAYSPEVTQAVHEIHRVHGALQELAIRHYYDMLAVLPADKQERLRAIALQALSEPE